MQESTAFPIQDISTFKQQVLQWASQFGTICYLDSNQYTQDKYSNFECAIGIDSLDSIQGSFEQLKSFTSEYKNKWIFGFLSYDLKNEVEKLSSYHPDYIQAPNLFFFKPRYVILIKKNKVIFNRNYPESFELKKVIEKQIVQTKINNLVDVKSRITKSEYIDTIEKIRQHIEEGDIYEMNFCKEYFAENVNINPFQLFTKLNQSAKAPFSAFFKYQDIYTLCTSPERFLQKRGSKLISQPIKGTIKSSKNLKENEGLKTKLKNDNKERAENVMIVDLVRNDLTKSAKTGSIEVEELFKIYSFETVNHMISTIVAEKEENIDSIDILKNTFPMGSMTGAPKVKVMQLIEKYEKTKRGIYSGSIGYFSPEGDFDFNVVIRSIIYNANNKYLSAQVGGAITYDSKASKEWEETELKAVNLKNSLT